MVENIERFKPLLEKNGSYYINRKKKFNPLFSVNEYVNDSVVWAFSQNHFKANKRDPKSIIKNAIQGKLGEFGIYKYFKSSGYNLESPDLKIRGYGEYDDGDLFLDDKKLQIKTTSHEYNILLLKKEDWDELGRYKWGKSGPDDSYKAFFLCRLKPSLEEVIPLDADYSIDSFNEILSNINFRIDIPGFVTGKDLKETISVGRYIKKKEKLNGSFVFENEFYYFQSGDLRDIDAIPIKRND